MTVRDSQNLGYSFRVNFTGAIALSPFRAIPRFTVTVPFYHIRSLQVRKHGEIDTSPHARGARMQHYVSISREPRNRSLRPARVRVLSNSRGIETEAIALYKSGLQS